MSTQPLWIFGGLLQEGVAGLMLDAQIAELVGVRPQIVATSLTTQTSTRSGLSFPVGDDYFHAALSGLDHTELDPTQLDCSGERPIIKIGLIQDPKQMRLVAERIRTSGAFVVLDPVLRSSRGLAFHDAASLATLRSELLPLADIVTPNLGEAALLCGLDLPQDFSEPTANEEAEWMSKAASRLMECGVKSVIIKGGHLSAKRPASDYVFHSGGHRGGRSYRLVSPRLDGEIAQTLRGKGCRFASAIAAFLAVNGTETSNLGLDDAIVFAKLAVARALSGGATVGATVEIPQALPIHSAASEPNATHRPLERLPIGLYPIADRALALQAALEAGEGRIRYAQIRVKDLEGAALAAELEQALRIAERFDCGLFINDHLDLAEQLGAFGVHLGQEDLADFERERLLRSPLKLGISTHSYFEAAWALGFAPRYVALGPIFDTTCKSMAFGPQGLDRIREWSELFGEGAAASKIPLVAIGGMKAEYAKLALNRGASGIAVISDLFHHPKLALSERVPTWLSHFPQSAKN